jgi:predicted XRE-type DNA-binding protein
MSEGQRFESVWDAIEDSPEKAVKQRAELMMQVQAYVESSGLTRREAVSRLGMTETRLEDLLRGRLDRFSLDRLVSLLARAGSMST